MIITFFKNVKNNIYYFFPFLIIKVLFCYPAFATDEQKREALEQLAQPFTQKQIFYRWESRERAEYHIAIGVMTPNLYTEFMAIHDTTSQVMGGGMYVSKSIHAYARIIYGDTITQVEVDPGVKYVDLTDYTVRETAQRILLVPDPYIEIEIARINPRIVIKYPAGLGVGDPWIIKSPRGVTFKPFSSREVPLRTLEEAYDEISKKEHYKALSFFKEAVRADILDRMNKDPSVNRSRSSLIRAVHLESPTSALYISEEALRSDYDERERREKEHFERERPKLTGGTSGNKTRCPGGF